MASSTLRDQDFITRDLRVFATIPVKYRPLYGVACVGEEEAWINGSDNTITRIDINGTVKDIFRTVCLTSPGGISVTSERELIFIDVNSEIVNIVRDGKVETLFNPPIDWVPTTLCCTRSGYILVHMYKGKDHDKEKKIIRVRGKNYINIVKDYSFGYGDCSLFMSENNNGDVCVSDPNANTVVVVDKTGRVRFRYDGTPARREKPFGPRGIVADALSQIIVTDFNNDCLHILDQNAQFLRCVDGCGLKKPQGLSVDSKGRLWVGLEESGNIKLIEYL